MAEQIQITIVGTGCIGASIGLALHKTGNAPLIVGHDRDPKHAAAARKIKAIDKSDWNLVNACEEADLVVLAIPCSGIEDTLRAIGPYLKSGCVITDTANLKQQVMDWANDILPDTVNFVGGNPILSSVGLGPEAAESDLFDGRLYCITSSPRTHPDAVSLVSSLVSILGATPYYVDAAEHDGLMAGATQLPLVLALTLTNSTTQAPGWREMRKLAGGYFDTISGLIGEDAEALSATLSTNQDHLISWIDAFAQEMHTLRRLLSDDTPESLLEFSQKAIDAHDQWLADRRTNFAEASPGADIERPNMLKGLFLGHGFQWKKDTK